MKNQLSLLAVALLLAQPVLAKDIPLNRAAALANSVTPAASSQAYDDLEQQALAQLRHALQGDAAALTRDRLAHAKQNTTQADTAWLKASGYDFQTRANQQAGIALLSAFSSLPETVVQQNLATVTAINRDAVQTTRRQALAVSSALMIRRPSLRYLWGGTSRLVGAGLALNTRPAKSKVEPWHGQRKPPGQSVAIPSSVPFLNLDVGEQPRCVQMPTATSRLGLIERVLFLQYSGCC